MTPNKAAEESWDRQAKELYLEYGKAVEFKNFQGNPMPEWEELPERIRNA